MTQTHKWTALVALTLAGAASGGEMRPTVSSNAPACRPAGHVLVRKSYAVAEQPMAPERLVRTILRAVEPVSWKEQGGAGTIAYRPEDKTLVVRQTADVHRQVASVLKALATVAPRHDAAKVLPAAYSPAQGTSPMLPPHLKQYGHFVLDNLRVNAMGVSCTVKRIRFMYKGDGIDADVAKCALTNGESEKKDLPKSVMDVLEKLSVESGKQKGCPTTGCSASTSSWTAPSALPPVAVSGSGSFNMPTSSASCGTTSTATAETKTDRGTAKACAGEAKPGTAKAKPKEKPEPEADKGYRPCH